MYVVLSAFLGSTVARPEDSGKAISPLMMLVIFSFLGVTTLGSAGDVFFIEDWFLHSFLSQPSLCLSVPSMDMRLVLNLGLHWELRSSLQ